MKTTRTFFAVITILFLFVTSNLFGQVLDPADLLLKAYQDKQPMPVLSAQLPHLDVPTAYIIQKAYVGKRLATDAVGGFKAGLTSDAGQQRFGVDAPLSGILFASGKRESDVTVSAADFNMLMLETEIGFVFEEPITEAVNDVAELQKNVRAVMPAIELPDLGFTDMKQLKGVDIIAADVSAAQFIVGSEQAYTGQNLNAIAVSLTLNGEEVNAGKGSDALGDQWNAALWLVNTMIDQGWTIDAGQVIITGALGNMIPGKPGKYIANYGDFGQIEFEITE